MVIHWNGSVTLVDECRPRDNAPAPLSDAVGEFADPCSPVSNCPRRQRRAAPARTGISARRLDPRPSPSGRRRIRSTFGVAVVPRSGPRPCLVSWSQTKRPSPAPLACWAVEANGRTGRRADRPRQRPRPGLVEHPDEHLVPSRSTRSSRSTGGTVLARVGERLRTTCST